MKHESTKSRARVKRKLATCKDIEIRAVKWFGSRAVVLATIFEAVEPTVVMGWCARRTRNILMLVVHLSSQLITVIWEVLTLLMPF